MWRGGPVWAPLPMGVSAGFARGDPGLWGGFGESRARVRRSLGGRGGAARSQERGAIW